MELFPFNEDMSLDTGFYAPEARKLPSGMRHIVAQERPAHPVDRVVFWRRVWNRLKGKELSFLEVQKIVKECAIVQRQNNDRAS
jgi:hypothetical protein